MFFIKVFSILFTSFSILNYTRYWWYNISQEIQRLNSEHTLLLFRFTILWAVSSDDSLNENKNVWKKLWNLYLLPSYTSALYGFTPEELNLTFPTFTSLLPEIILAQSAWYLLLISYNGFAFLPLTINDVIVAVMVFPQSVHKITFCL